LHSAGLDDDDAPLSSVEEGKHFEHPPA
jgi:hypothetical protein